MHNLRWFFSESILKIDFIYNHKKWKTSNNRNVTSSISGKAATQISDFIIRNFWSTNRPFENPQTEDCCYQINPDLVPVFTLFMSNGRICKYFFDYFKNLKVIFVIGVHKLETFLGLSTPKIFFGYCFRWTNKKFGTPVGPPSFGLK